MVSTPHTICDITQKDANTKLYLRRLCSIILSKKRIKCNISRPVVAVGVCSLCLVGSAVWAGTEDGSVLVWDGMQEGLLSQSKVHADRVSCLECVGSHVWSGSGDRTIVAHGAQTFQMLYSLNDQGVQTTFSLHLLPVAHCGSSTFICCKNNC